MWNAVEQARFLEASANLNPVVADVEATSDDCETQQCWKRIEIFNVRRKTKVRQDSYCRTRESNVRIKDTDNSLFLFSL